MPKTLSVREDSIIEHLPAMLIRTGIDPAGDPATLADKLRTHRITLIYDHNDKTVTADCDDGPIRITIR